MVGAIAESFFVRVGVEPGVDGNDQVGFERRDLVDLNSVVQVEDNGLGRPELGPGPRPHAERLVTEPVGHRDGDHPPDRQQIVLLGEAGADDTFRRCGDGGFAEDVLDGHRGGGLASSPDLFGEQAAATSTPRRSGCSQESTPGPLRAHGARLTHHQRDAESNHCGGNQTVEDPPRQRSGEQPGQPARAEPPG